VTTGPAEAGTVLPGLDRAAVVDNALVRYDATVRAALARLGASGGTAPGPGTFDAGVTLPAPGDRLSHMFAASELAFADLGEYGGKRLTLLDLTRNPRTRTTKTCASLVIAARAVDHVQRTGERVMIVSPSSGNKATALRDAVLRAYEAGLVTPEQLSILVVVPHSSRRKLWASPLTDDPGLRARNPVATYEGQQRADVKELAQALVGRCSADLFADHGVRLWYTLDIENYKVADVVRACAENEFLPGCTCTPCPARTDCSDTTSAPGWWPRPAVRRRPPATSSCSTWTPRTWC
jgi:hypothetical protein